MKTIIAVIIAIIATYLLTAAALTRPAYAPVTSTPSGSIVIPLSIVSLREDASSSPTVTIEYPQFGQPITADFNNAISSSTLGRLAEFRSTMTDNQAARAATSNKYPTAAISPNAYSFISNWQPTQINSRYVSFIVRYDSYTGGANENQELQTFNYDVASNRSMTLADLFGTSTDYLTKISRLARQQLSASLEAASPGYDPTTMMNAGTEPAADNFQYFTFTDNSVTFYFPKYAVAPGSFGEQHVTIPRSELMR